MVVDNYNEYMNHVIQSIAFKFLSIISPQLAKKHTDSISQFIKFGLVGVTNTLISYGINISVLLLLKNVSVAWDYIVGNVVAFILSVLWSFYWNNKYVFQGNNRTWWKTLLKTYLCYGFTGIVLSNILSWVWIIKLNISKYIAPFLNLIISVPLNFILNKIWAFK